jgi:hypothetical protein
MTVKEQMREVETELSDEITVKEQMREGFPQILGPKLPP